MKPKPKMGTDDDEILDPNSSNNASKDTAVSKK